MKNADGYKRNEIITYLESSCGGVSLIRSGHWRVSMLYVVVPRLQKECEAVLQDLKEE